MPMVHRRCIARILLTQIYDNTHRDLTLQASACTTKAQLQSTLTDSALYSSSGSCSIAQVERPLTICALRGVSKYYYCTARPSTTVYWPVSRRMFMQAAQRSVLGSASGNSSPPFLSSMIGGRLATQLINNSLQTPCLSHSVVPTLPPPQVSHLRYTTARWNLPKRS
jgi:hypothetical protein